MTWSCASKLKRLGGRKVSWNVMAHAQKPDFVFRPNGRVHLNRRERQFSRLLAAEVCASAVVILDTPCSEVVWRILATHSIRQLPLHFPSRASPCAITFQLESTPNRATPLLRRLVGKPRAVRVGFLVEKVVPKTGLAPSTSFFPHQYHVTSSPYSFTRLSPTYVN